MSDEEYEIPPIKIDPIEVEVEHKIDPIEVEVEHSFHWLVLIVFIFVSGWIGSFDTEIRCALGSEKACASLKVSKAPQ